MFSKPDWFRPGRKQGRVRPRSFSGWLHTATWSVVLAAPFLVLLNLHRGPEAWVWLATMACGWWLDLQPVRRAHRLAHEKELFVIDDQTDVTQLSAAPRRSLGWRRAFRGA